MTSKEFTELMLDELESATHTGYWCYHIDEMDINMSRVASDILGVDENTAPSEYFDFYHEDDQQLVKRAFDECIEYGKEYRLNARIIKKDRPITYVEIHGKALGVSHQVKSVFGTIKDITKDVLLIHQKNKHLRLYDELIKSINYCFIVAETDAQGRITSVNKKFCEISGYAREELIGQDHRILNSGTHTKEFFKDLWDTIKRGEPWHGLVCNTKKNGEYYWVQTYIFPRFENDKVSGYIAMRYDVTESVLQSHELEKQKKNSEGYAHLAAVGEISAGIAHEINNPLYIILGKTQFLSKYKDNEDKFNEIIESVEHSANRIKSIINGLSYVAQKSRDNSHKMHSLNSIIKNSYEFYLEALNKHRIRLELAIEDEKELFISCDEVKISQVILNLVNNAKDSILESKVSERWIKLVLSSDDKFVYVSIYDSGPGVPEDLKSEVMKPFFTTKEVGKGTGLGLSLVNSYLYEHKGTIEIIEDQIGRGFRFFLPKL